MPTVYLCYFHGKLYDIYINHSSKRRISLVLDVCLVRLLLTATVRLKLWAARIHVCERYLSISHICRGNNLPIMSTQHCVNAAPLSRTLAQHWYIHRPQRDPAGLEDDSAIQSSKFSQVM